MKTHLASTTCEIWVATVAKAHRNDILGIFSRLARIISMTRHLTNRDRVSNVSPEGEEKGRGAGETYSVSTFYLFHFIHVFDFSYSTLCACVKLRGTCNAS